MQIVRDFNRRFGMACLSGVLLLLAHLMTSVIQRDPWQFRKWLETGAPCRFFDPWMYPVLVGAVIALWAMFSWLHSLKAISGTVVERLASAWGKPATALFLLCSLLPQRVMDDNSGYVFLSSDNPVWWLVCEMDWARTMLAFDLLFRLIGCEPASADRRPVSVRGLAALSLVSLGLSVLIGQWALGGIPHVQDEIIQDWHARLLGAGRTTSPEMDVRASFQVAGIGDNGKSLFSTYQPAFGYLLAVAHRIGAGALLNPALGALAFWLFFLVLRRSHGEETARMALLIGLLSPFAILMQAGLMNHVLMLFLLVVGACSLQAADRGMLREAAVMGGLALGLSWMTRRVDAVALHLAWLACWFVLTPFSGRRVFWVLTALAISGGTLTLNMQLSASTAGDALNMIRHGQTVVQNLGTFEFSRLFTNLSDNLCGITVFAFGGVLAAFAGLGLLCPLRRDSAGLIERFFLINAGFVMLGYFVYDYQDFCYGPRYFFPVLPLALLGMSVFLGRLRDIGASDAVHRLLIASVCVSVVLVAGQAWGVLGNEFWHISPGLTRFVEQFRGRPHILFVQSPTRQRLVLARHLQRTWGFTANDLLELLSGDFIDTVGLKQYLDRTRPGTKEECVKYIEQYQNENRFRRPESYAISIYEIPRLNSVEPLTQEVVLAVDRGDFRNEALLRTLPNHQPLLMGRVPAGYFVEPYQRAGVAEFGDLLVP